MATVSIIFRKDKINKNGACPIHFRIIKFRKVSYVSSGIFVSPDQWDDDKNRVKPKHPNSARINSLLSNKFTELQDKVYEHETSNVSATTKQLKEKIFGKAPDLFFEFTDGIIVQYQNEGKIATYDKNRSIIAKLKKYVKEKSISFQDITPEFLLKYENYLRGTLNNHTNTIYKDLKFIRKLFNDAIRLDVIEPQINPFLKYKLKQEKTQRSYLTESEFEAFMNVENEPSSKLNLYQDMFVFAAFCGGLRVSDVLTLKWHNFDGKHVSIVIKKTNSQINIKVPNKAIEILLKYKLEESESTDFIFPLIANTVNVDDPREIDTEISRGTANINKGLKTIASSAKITKNVSFHISRHTWATRALIKGISIDKVSKLMGHSNIKETQIYAKIVNSELDNAMDVFND